MVARAKTLDDNQKKFYTALFHWCQDKDLSKPTRIYPQVEELVEEKYSYMKTYTGTMKFDSVLFGRICSKVFHPDISKWETDPTFAKDSNIPNLLLFFLVSLRVKKDRPDLSMAVDATTFAGANKKVNEMWKRILAAEATRRERAGEQPLAAPLANAPAAAASTSTSTSTTGTSTTTSTASNAATNEEDTYDSHDSMDDDWEDEQDEENERLLRPPTQRPAAKAKAAKSNTDEDIDDRHDSMDDDWEDDHINTQDTIGSATTKTPGEDNAAGGSRQNSTNSDDQGSAEYEEEEDYDYDDNGAPITFHEDPNPTFLQSHTSVNGLPLLDGQQRNRSNLFSTPREGENRTGTMSPLPRQNSVPALSGGDNHEKDMSKSCSDLSYGAGNIAPDEQESAELQAANAELATQLTDKDKEIKDLKAKVARLESGSATIQATGAANQEFRLILMLQVPAPTNPEWKELEKLSEVTKTRLAGLTELLLRPEHRKYLRKATQLQFCKSATMANQAYQLHLDERGEAEQYYLNFIQPGKNEPSEFKPCGGKFSISRQALKCFIEERLRMDNPRVMEYYFVDSLSILIDTGNSYPAQPISRCQAKKCGFMMLSEEARVSTLYAKSNFRIHPTFEELKKYGVWPGMTDGLVTILQSSEEAKSLLQVYGSVFFAYRVDEKCTYLASFDKFSMILFDGDSPHCVPATRAMVFFTLASQGGSPKEAVYDGGSRYSKEKLVHSIYKAALEGKVDEDSDESVYLRNLFIKYSEESRSSGARDDTIDGLPKSWDYLQKSHERKMAEWLRIPEVADETQAKIQREKKS